MSDSKNNKSTSGAEDRSASRPVGGGPRRGGGGGRGGRTMGGPPPKITKGNIKSLGRALAYIFREYKLRFLLVMLCIVTTAVTSTMGSLFLRTLIDNYITPLLAEANPVFSGLLRAIGKMGALYAIGIMATLCQSLLLVTISQGVMKKIRDDMFFKMQKLPIKFFDTHTHGNLMSHFTNDTDTLRQLLGNSFPSLCSTAITVVVVLVSMIALDLLLTGFVLVFTFGIMLLLAKVGGKSAKYFREQQKSLGSLNGYIEEMINGQKVIKVFCYEERSKEDFNAGNEELCDNATSANKFANILWPLMGSLGNIQYVALAILGGSLAISGFAGLTIGTVISFLQLSRTFTMQINQVSQQMNSVITALAGADRIFNLMDQEPEEDAGFVTLVNADLSGGVLAEAAHRTGVWAWKYPMEDGTVTYTQVKGDVRFRDVTFGYEPEKTVLYDLSLFAKPGQKLAFVGATGAGKTTITNLINRFYDINEGEITYDGIDISKIKKNDLRRSLGIVLQDVNLFTGTVMDNIRYGKLDATDEECINAAKLANAHGFISLLPEGYDTILSGEGANLSQGQRQLLSIARAAVSDPPVMILDEATSSIDTRTELLVQKGMDALMHGRTVFVIAHRLSTVQNSNAIIVLELGHIIERGSHEQLIEERGKYYQLYTGAFELG